jgi:hypothetical protein
MSDAATIVPSLTNAHQWQIVPQGFFSRHYNLVWNGQTVATLRMSLWTEGCEFTIAGHSFAIRRASMWKDGFLLATDGQTVCEVKRSFWSRQFALGTGEQTWTLKPAGFFTRTYQLLVDTREAGTIRPAGWFTRKHFADFATNVPPPIQVLAIFLFLVIHQREQRNSSSGS